MARPAIKRRERYFLAVEGESEQSFARWLQELADEHFPFQEGLGKDYDPIHLDVTVLGGGGVGWMLKEAFRLHKRKVEQKRPYNERILLIDSDRLERPDRWTEKELRNEASRHNFKVCLQRPNHEGLLLRMVDGMEKHGCLDPSLVVKQLKQHWPTYEKGAPAQLLRKKFGLRDLLRAAQHDADLRTLLATIGLQNL